MKTGDGHWLLSGGIGCGKSVVRRILAQNGWYVVDADSVGHDVLESDGPAFRQVTSRWPDVVVDGVIDRGALGRIVFADPAELEALEQITHPFIFGRIQADIQGIDGPVAVELPLLKNPFGTRWLRMIVDSRDEARLARLQRRGMAEEEARARMHAQPSRGEWLAAADVVIPNHEDEEGLMVPVRRLASLLAG